jgi:glycosyltransferase involved in cell wall biosynthesis
MTHPHECIPANQPTDLIAASKIRVCIATYEIMIYHRNGGIGNANTGLAIALAEQGFDVTVALGTTEIDSNLVKCSQYFSHNHGIKIVNIPIAQGVRSGETLPMSRQMSYCFHCWLESNPFDIVNLDDYGALGFYALMAKKAGISHLNTSFICQVHGPKDWLLRAQNLTFSGLDDACIIDTERFCIENADHTVFVSQYMHDLLISYGYQLDAHKTHIKSYISPYWINRSLPDQSSHSGNSFAYKPNSIAFFGRQEERKGYKIFLDAIDLLQLQGFDADIHILGKFSVDSLGTHSGLELVGRLNSWNSRVFVHAQLDSKEAIELIREKKCLVVIPSLSDNLPNTVLECIEYRFPFITSVSGGQQELIDRNQHSCFLCQARPVELSQHIQNYFADGAPTVAAQYDLEPSDIISWWSSLFRDCYRSLQQASYSRIADLPRITVGIVHYNQPYLLLQTLKSLEDQTYMNFEIIICDDGSSNAEARDLIDRLEKSGVYCNMPLRVYRNSNRYLGAARNTILSHCSTKYIVFMDDDNYALPKQLELLTRAIAHTSAGAITLMAYKHCSPSSPNKDNIKNIIYYPIGQAKLSGLFQNMFGDANAIYSVAALRSISGFFEEPKVPYEDWHCFQRLLLAGYKIYVLPLPLMHYRVRGGSMLRSTSPVRPIQLMSHEIGKAAASSWIYEYVHQSAMKPFVDERNEFIREANQLHNYRHLGLSKALSHEKRTDVEQLVIEQICLHNREIDQHCAALNASISRDTLLPKDEQLALFRNDLKRRLDLIAQSRMKDIDNHLKASDVVFEVSLRDMEPGVDVIHLSGHCDRALGYSTFDIQCSGLLLHPHGLCLNSAVFPSMIPNYAKFIRVGFFIPDDIGCNNPAQVRLSRVNQINFSVDRSIQDSMVTSRTEWWRIYPNGKIQYVYLACLADLVANKDSLVTENSASLLVEANIQEISDYCHLRIHSISILA